MRDQRTERWSNPAGEAFRIVGWPSEQPTGTALIVHHGLGEHGGRYQTFARELHDLPVQLWTFDARGHGESVGKKGDAAGLDQYADDLLGILPALIEHAGAERVILMGHSMGGAVVGHTVTTRGLPEIVTGLILSAPPVQVDKSLPIRIKLALARVLRRLSPTLTLANELDTDHISSVRAEVERYLADPLVHDRLSVRLALSLVEDGPRIVDNARGIELPGLLYQGLDDGIVSIEGTRALARAWGHEDVELHEFEGLRHECHHEHPDGVREVFGMLRSWLEPRI